MASLPAVDHGQPMPPCSVTHPAVVVENSTEHWRGLAECRSVEVSRFYSSNNTDQSIALAACARCVVRDACLSVAMEEEAHGWRYGIRGGLTPRQRGEHLAAVALR